MQSSKRNLSVAGLLVLVVGLMAIGVAIAEEPAEAPVPTVRVVVPNLSNQEAKVMPPTFTVGVLGADADSPTGLPVKFRILMTSAQYGTDGQGDPLYIRTPFEYNLHAGDVLSWDDPDWSDWLDYPEAPEPAPAFEFVDLGANAYYLMATQVMDADGAVSVALGYQLEVFNFQVRSGVFRPEVTICETFLGCPSSSEIFNEIAGGQPLNFSWIASAEAYAGEIVSYRHGYDLIDPDDPNDPGWSVPPGLAPVNMFAAERIFEEGLHTFYLRVVDSANQVRLITWHLAVIPFVSPEYQHQLLVIDQVFDPDALTNNWQDQEGNSRNSEVYRNAYWHFLAEGSGGVSDFNWDRDWKNHVDNVQYSDLVNYKTVLCYAQFNDQNQLMFEQFRPVHGVDQYVWLTPYQERGGNFFLVGHNSMESFMEGLTNYMVPMIFDATETTLLLDGQPYVVGFGNKELPDGTSIQRGPTLYPYATAGIAALDWTSPSTKYIYMRPNVVRFDRKVDCVGLKGLVLDPDFRANHAVSAGAIADTFFTDQVIDWHDVVAADSGTLELFSNTFPFRTDEFVDFNLSTRAIPVIPQLCEGSPEAPGGMCVEPMFRGISRMDWLREYRFAEGDLDWPQSQYDNFELDNGCGPLGLTSHEGQDRSSSVTNGLNYGYLSYKMIEDKPSRKADVYWGFDPYRFDPNETKKAVRWVLDYFGLNINP